MKHETVSNVVQALPATTLVGVKVFGLSMPDWAAIIGIAFVFLQVAFLLWDRWQKRRK